MKGYLILDHAAETLGLSLGVAPGVPQVTPHLRLTNITPHTYIR